MALKSAGHKAGLAAHPETLRETPSEYQVEDDQNKPDHR
jgi:hypothetical protein